MNKDYLIALAAAQSRQLAATLESLKKQDRAFAIDWMSANGQANRFEKLEKERESEVRDGND